MTATAVELETEHLDFVIACNTGLCTPANEPAFVIGAFAKEIPPNSRWFCCRPCWTTLRRAESSARSLLFKIIEVL